MENNKKIFLISGILIVLVVGVLLLLWLRYRASQPVVTTISTSTPLAEGALPEVPATIIVTSTSDAPEIDAFQAQVDGVRKTDQDLDGLSDVDEAKYGTSKESSDTDQDGLLDKDEITIFKTNPLKADTDGDGHPDGLEVRNGYNPNGAGKLVVNP